MIPYAFDPSLHAAEPAQPLLDDGFSPPKSHGEPPQPVPSTRSREEALASKIDF